MGLFVLRLLSNTPWRFMILLCLSVTLLDPRSFKLKDGKFSTYPYIFWLFTKTEVIGVLLLFIMGWPIYSFGKQNECLMIKGCGEERRALGIDWG